MGIDIEDIKIRDSRYKKIDRVGLAKLNYKISQVTKDKFAIFCKENGLHGGRTLEAMIDAFLLTNKRRRK